MYLENIALANFRNFSNAKIKFDRNINIFIGDNAQGKTNLLEAIYFLALARSHRTNGEKELIKFENDFANIQGKLKKSQIEVDLKIRITAKGKKAWINRLEQKKLSRYVGQMNVILFSPEDLALVKGRPGLRRRFMDLEFGQINPEYLYFSSKYRQVLQQRNNYLKQLSIGRAKDLVFLDVLSDQLAGIAAEIILRRKKYILLLNNYAQKAHEKISGNNEKLEINYYSSINGIADDDNTEVVYQKVLANFQANQKNEIRKGMTLSGPQRDDLKFWINQKSAQDFASQGQQRTIALSVKLAEIKLVQKITQEYPILLLDDVMSELDYQRQSSLLSYIQGNIQTFITTTTLEGISWEIIKTPKIYHISDGIVN